jgi:hypothetical protein
VFSADSTTVLWDSPNPWRDAWANRKVEGTLVPTIVPVGEIADLSAIDAPQALAGETAALEKISALYGGGDVVVTHAKERDGAIEVTTTRYGSAGALRNVQQTTRPNPGEKEDAVMARAIDAVARELDEAWKRDNLLRVGPEASLTVIVPTSGLSDWVAVRERLIGIAAIRRVDVAAVSRSEVRLDLKYVGDPAQLRLALAQRDLVLAQGEPYWTLRQRGGAARP